MGRIKDPISGFSHLVGAALSIAGLVLMIVFASLHGNAYTIVSVALFGTTLLLLYTASTLYHLLNLKKKGDTFFKKLDHIMIYFLIAGTYTPIVLGPLRGGWGWSIFGVVWGLAIARIVFNTVLD
ncbi:MAG: hemolysin III family protein [Oscillospiraceae bacterium]|nr:hemolysin III family protein [Oscillospiraceae bacterium]